MVDFITLTDAITEQKIIIKTSVIRTIEESIFDSSSGSYGIRMLTFIDDHPNKYVKESIKYIFSLINAS